jgi:hypothetical protein
MDRRAFWHATVFLAATAGVCCSGCRKGDPSQSTTTAQTSKKPAAPASYAGSLDVTDSTHITGWAWDRNRPDAPIQVDIYDGDNLITTVPADQFRQDLLDNKIGNGKHRFLYNPPARLKDGQEHIIHAKFSGFDTEVRNSPKKLTTKGSPGK